MTDTGVPLQGFKGVPANTGRGQFGVPIPGQGKQRPTDTPAPVCGGVTKKGEPCKAHPVKGEDLCVGHKRAAVGD